MLQTEIQSTALPGNTEPQASNVSGMTEIAGSRLQERIGMGGFGEVWRAPELAQ